ncbi:hypothetical protein BJV77DRAFT_963440 [Russula vinacea]|nr:hypothetical protein BJV77DRAFT_963440 [Russula vinacea]
MSSPSKLQLVFDNALRAYEGETKIYLLAHPLAARLQSCDSPSAILALLREHVRDGDDRQTRWLDPTVNVINAHSMVLGERVNLVISPAKLIFTGVGVLLSTAKSGRAIQDSFVDLFEYIGSYFQRLEAYIEVPLTMAMRDIAIQIMVEVLSILAIATKEIKFGRTSEQFVYKHVTH